MINDGPMRPEGRTMKTNNTDLSETDLRGDDLIFAFIRQVVGEGGDLAEKGKALLMLEES